MIQPLLRSKLSIPQLGDNNILRPNLLSLLDTPKSLTLVSAPAGYGKTTLITQWIQHNQSAHETLWLSLDSEDNEPSRFLDYLDRALETLSSVAKHRIQITIHNA